MINHDDQLVALHPFYGGPLDGAINPFKTRRIGEDFAWCEPYISGGFKDHKDNIYIEVSMHLGNCIASWHYCFIQEKIGGFTGGYWAWCQDSETVRPFSIDASNPGVEL